MLYHILFLTKYFLANLGINSEKGQTLAEYSLLLMLIVLVVIGALTIFGTSLRDYWTSIKDEIALVL